MVAGRDHENVTVYTETRVLTNAGLDRVNCIYKCINGFIYFYEKSTQ